MFCDRQKPHKASNGTFHETNYNDNIKIGTYGLNRNINFTFGSETRRSTVEIISYTSDFEEKGDNDHDMWMT